MLAAIGSNTATAQSARSWHSHTADSTLMSARPARTIQTDCATEQRLSTEQMEIL